MVAYALRKLILPALSYRCGNLFLHSFTLNSWDTAEALAGPQASVEDVENLRRSLGLTGRFGAFYLLTTWPKAI